MCIRDRKLIKRVKDLHQAAKGGVGKEGDLDIGNDVGNYMTCLLYTSDAADERSSVDLGGRRIIKKKKIDAQRIRRVSTSMTNTKQNK